MMKVKENSFGRTAEGRNVIEYVVTNGNDISFSVIPFGATLRSVRTPDRNGKFDDIVLGFDTLGQYLLNPPYFGSTVGRFANRIGGASFSIGDMRYQLSKNDGRNHLHGGPGGYAKVWWNAEPFQKKESAGVKFIYISPDGEEHYPGTLSVAVVYSLTEKNELLIEYSAVTDAVTPVNLTNHAYWNLAGAGSGNIFSHELRINASRYLSVDKELIPTGNMDGVEGTPFDFRIRKKIGRDFSKVEGGYDHCFVIDEREVSAVPSVELIEPGTGRGMRVYQSQPGIQLYTSNMLTRTEGAGNRIFDRYGALCLETEGFPDSVNRPQFPSPFLRPGEIYSEWTRHELFTV